jgi:hypothetical protein
MLIAIYAECHIQVLLLSVLMLIVFMLSVVMLNDFMLSVLMLNVFMLSVVMLNVFMLSVVMLNVVADPIKNKWKFMHFCKLDGFSAVEFF